MDVCLNMQGYNGFNLVVGDISSGSVVHVSNRGGVIPVGDRCMMEFGRVRLAEVGVYVLQVVALPSSGCSRACMESATGSCMRNGRRFVLLLLQCGSFA